MFRLSMTDALNQWFEMLTKRYALHLPEPIGPYAASYLERRYWDHT